MTFTARPCHRFLSIAALVLLSPLALMPAPGLAQTSAAAAVTHSAGTGTLTPRLISAVLNAKQDCSHQPFSPDQAFQVTAAASSSNTIRIDWTIADGCYLYRNRIKAKTASGVPLGTLALPEGESHSDEYFGTQQIYHHTVSATLPVTRSTAAGELNIPVDVTYQGCAESLCYPPITKTLNVTLPPAGAADSGIAGAATDQAKFLNPDVAFQASATAAGPDSVRLDWKIAEGTTSTAVASR